MNYTILFPLLLALTCSALWGEPVDVNGRFQSTTAGGFPDGWVMHEWGGYKPFPAVKTVPGAYGDSTALSITNVLGDDGGAIQTRAKFPARSGSTGRISFLAKGKGLAWVTFYRWGEKGTWNGVIVSSPFTLSGTWQPHVLTIPIDNGHACETAAVTLAIGGKMGAEIQVCHLTLDLQPPRIVGDTRLPRSWTIFGPVDKDLKPSQEQLQSIPETFGGATAQTAHLISNTLDFGPFAGPGPDRCVWAFAPIEARYDCDMTAGAGAGGSMHYYLNGEPVFNTPAAGNARSPVEIDNHVKNVRLKQGRNVIAVKTVLDGASPVLKLAGPLDLRGTVRRLQFSRRIFEENFDGSSVRCSGNPLLIQGNPTPGLLSVTGQGVFKTDAELSITCPIHFEELPGKPDANLFAAAGVRIQNFGREPSQRQNAAFEIIASDLTCRILSRKDPAVLTLAVLENETRLETLGIPSNSLPADFVFGVNGSGKWTASIHSLVDSKTASVSGVRKAPGPSTGEFSYRLLAEKGPAEVTVDNLVIGLAAQESKTSSTPFKLDLVPQFDPVAAGWKKVFDEEFDGDRVDPGKWYFSPASEKDYAKVHDGLLEIVCNWATPDKTKTESASLYSNEVFGHGYYEARVKFRQQSGWWSAFWLCTHGPSNPFLDGWEIDIYEDYYMGPANPGEEPRGILDHNLHVFACGTLRSWNYGSKLPGKVDDWYVVACKWTPFEVSYYLNGRLIQSEANHSPYSSVTFDPFNHAAGYVPLHAIVSGCCGKSGGDPAKGKFPESFFVDYVRIYEYPHDSGPVVRLVKKPDESTYILKPGEALRFEAQVEPSPDTGAKIQQVYLFDSGALLDYRSAPPYEFVVRITQDYYGGTNFVKPGRTGIRPDWDRGLHAFCIFAQDERGNVGHSDNVVKLLRKNGKTGPYLGKPVQLPGAIMLSHYDEGGQGFAYSDGTPGNNASKTFRANEDVDAGETVIGGVSGGEWLKYTVHVNQTANYTFTLDYGTPSPKQRGPKLMVDCKAAGDFETPAHEFPDWRHTSKAVLKAVPLTAGDHEIVLLMQGSYNLGGLNVDVEADYPAFAADPTAAAAQARAEIWRRFIDKHGVMVDFTDLDGSVNLPTPEECRQGKPNALGWFQSIENGAMFTGSYMDAAILAWQHTKSQEAAARSRRLMEGLLLLSSISEVKGFVGRGVSTDGKSHFAMGSDDQTAPWFWGLWRYLDSGLATDPERERIVGKLVETADALVALAWRMPAEPPFGTRGSFAELNFDGVARQLFVMKMMHAVTGEMKWDAMYREALRQRGGEENLSKQEICRRGMVFWHTGNPKATHHWTSASGVAALRGLWELEGDAGLKESYAQGLRASAGLAARTLPLAEHFDPDDQSAFSQDWRSAMLPLWEPQQTAKEAQALAGRQLREFSKVSPRRHKESAFIREPASAAWIVTLCPDPAVVKQHACGIERVIRQFDYRRLYYCTFYWVEAAWWRLKTVNG